MAAKKPSKNRKLRKAVKIKPKQSMKVVDKT